MILTALSIIPLAYTMWTHFRGLRSEAGERSLEAWSTWATFCLALAGFWSIVLAIKRDMRKSKEEARRVKTAGYTSGIRSLPKLLHHLTKKHITPIYAESRKRRRRVSPFRTCRSSSKNYQRRVHPLPSWLAHLLTYRMIFLVRLPNSDWTGMDS